MQPPRGSILVQELLEASTAAGMNKHSSYPDRLMNMQNLEGQMLSLESQLRKVQEELQQQQERNHELLSQLRVVETDRNSLQEQIKYLEESKKRSLESLSMEKNAAIVAREDLVAQLRVLKKRIQEAEEEQYKAEENAAFLRAELEALHHREEKGSHTLNSTLTPEQFRAMEQELDTLKVELQKALHQVQSEQQKLDAERRRVTELAVEKEQLKDELMKVSQKIKGDHFISNGSQNARISEATQFSKTYGNHEQQLRELASMVERLESGRQKLLKEVDTQSLEIERLFMENSSLMVSLKDAAELEAQLRKHVQACLEENSGLRDLLNELRMEKTKTVARPMLENFISEGKGDKESTNDPGIELMKEENSKLKVELAKAQGRAEALNAQVFQLSADLIVAMKNVTGLSRLYTPVLANIENQLLQLRHDSNSVNSISY